MNKTIAKLALHHVHELRDQQRRYDEETESFARDGYRNSHCIHGTYMWTDYDNICGPCEDGYGRYEGHVLYELALAQAHSDWARFEKRIDMVMTFVEDGKANRFHVPTELRDALVAWSLADLPTSYTSTTNN